MSDFVLGEAVRVAAVFRNAAGTVADPTAVLFKYRDPAGAITPLAYPTDVALVKDSTGNYHVDIDASMAGTWNWRFYATGTGKTANEGSFTVGESVFD